MVKKKKIIPCIVQNNRPTNKTNIMPLLQKYMIFFTQIDYEFECKLSASQRGEFASK